MMEYREAILRNPTSAYPYLAWGWTLERMSRLAGWIAEHRVSIATSDDIGRHSFAHLITQLAQHPERAAQRSRQLVQTATHLEPTAAFTHYSAGLYALQQWETLPAAERARVMQQLRRAVQLEPTYAPVLLQALWERAQDRELVRTLARGTSEEAVWRIDGGKIAGGR